jgi:hypothetical protein
MVGEFWEFAEFVSALAGHEKLHFWGTHEIAFFRHYLKPNKLRKLPKPPKHKTIGKSQESI